VTTRAPGGARHQRSSADSRDPRPAGSKGHQADARRDQRDQARREDRFLNDVYQDGVREGQRAAKTKPSTSSPRRPTSSTARRVGRQVQRSATAPVTGALYTGARIAGLMVLLAFLYLVLTNVPTATTLLNALRRGVGWAKSPTTSIPFKAGS
jgi:hypothetical protein